MFSPTVASSESTGSQFRPSVNIFPQHLASFPPLTLPPAPSQVALVNCLTPGCSSARIRKGCTHQRCKHHSGCKERGGCLSHGNMQKELIIQDSLPASFTPPPISEDTSHTTRSPTLSSVPSPWSPILPPETHPSTRNPSSHHTNYNPSTSLSWAYPCLSYSAHLYIAVGHRT